MNLDSYFNFKNKSITYGLTDELIAFYVDEVFKKENRNIILVTSNLYESNKLYNIIKLHNDNTDIFLMDDFITSKVVAASPEFTLGRLNVLENLKHKKEIIVTNLMGFLKYLPNKNEINSISLVKGMDINRNNLIEKLENYGYNHESLVTTSGEYSLRGFIIDIYVINEVHPIRIEFFGNTIESIRYFDENTQRTTNEINKIEILPFNEIKTTSNSSLYDYSNDGIVVYLNKNQIDVAYKKLLDEINEYNLEKNIQEKYMYDFEEINPNYELYIDTITNKSDITAMEITPFNEDFELLKNNYYKWLKENKKVYFYLSKVNEIKIIK